MHYNLRLYRQFPRHEWRYLDLEKSILNYLKSYLLIPTVNYTSVAGPLLRNTADVLLCSCGGHPRVLRFQLRCPRGILKTLVSPAPPRINNNPILHSVLEGNELAALPHRLGRSFWALCPSPASWCGSVPFAEGGGSGVPRDWNLGNHGRRRRRPG